MPENEPPQSETPYPDAEDWQIVFDIYAGKPSLALSLAHDLNAVQQCLQGERKRIPDALAALDLAIDALYEHTQFRSMSHELYRAAVEGRITIEQEQLLSDLGVKI